jgi:hypothetical protein
MFFEIMSKLRFEEASPAAALQILLPTQGIGFVEV